MEMLNITLDNFQGIRHLSLDFPGGCNATIYGDNAVGKTTVYNALTWLLFGRASTGVKGFSPKSRGADGELHNLTHSVTGTFDDGGRMITLGKSMAEIWKKKRGAKVAEFSGHTTDYTVDGVPVKEKEYDETVLSLCGGDMEKPKMLTMPDYLPEQMPWDARRRILLEVCGDVSDADVIAATLELTELDSYLIMPGTTDRHYTIDEYRKIATARRKDINKDLDALPGRIDEADKAIPDTSGCNADTIAANIAAADARIRQLQTERAGIVSGGAGLQAAQQALAAARLELTNAKAAHIEAQSARNAAANAEILSQQTEAAKARARALAAESNRNSAQEKRDKLEARRNALIDEYNAIRAETWDAGSEICPTCGQRLPADKIDQMRSDFNLKKSQRLQANAEKGKAECSRDMIAALADKIAGYETEMQTARDDEAACQARIEALQAKLVAVEPFEGTDACAALTQKIAELDKAMQDECGASAALTKDVDKRIAAQNALRDAEIAKRTLLTTANLQAARKAELERQEEQLAAELEQTEKGLYLCDVFTKAKVSLLDERINGKFRNVRFQMFTEQVNGGIKEGCEVLVPSPDGSMVPYATANNVARINAGLEIIETLSDSWGIKMPVVVDNAEAVTRLTQISTQVIRLVVSEPDKTLRLELGA